METTQLPGEHADEKEKWNKAHICSVLQISSKRSPLSVSQLKSY